MSPTRRPLPPRRPQSGVVLFIALIVMVALSIAGIALIRSVDTGMSITANLGFRQASIPPSTWAVENAISAMFEKKTISDLEKKNLNENYYAYRFEIKDNSKPEDKMGVPYHLQGAGTSPPNYPGTFQKTTDAAGNTIRYVIERMCLDEGPATAANCDMSPPKKSEATTAMELVKPELIRVPFYRLTVRVDGPNNTTTFAQAMLR
jgi:type IV pilus assembly protein PilX